MKQITQFRFKQFAVWHHRSSMKVGVDGVLIGCWTDLTEAKRILDVGTGCGLIALIMAQRSPYSEIIGIDIHEDSVMEARLNVESSPWKGRIKIFNASFTDNKTISEDWSRGKFDLLISNPPYFDSGVTVINTARERARHQSDLSPFSLLNGAKTLLNPEGSVSMVIPYDICDSVEEFARSSGFRLIRKCLVRGHNSAQYKRVLLQWRKSEKGSDMSVCKPEFLTLEISPGIPSQDYLKLCSDFYLKF